MVLTKEIKLIAGGAIIALLIGAYFYIDTRAYKRGYQAAENKYLKEDKAELETTIEATAAATVEVTAGTEKAAEINNKSETIRYVYLNKPVPVDKPEDNQSPVSPILIKGIVFQRGRYE